MTSSDELHVGGGSDETPQGPRDAELDAHLREIQRVTHLHRAASGQLESDEDFLVWAKREGARQRRRTLARRAWAAASLLLVVSLAALLSTTGGSDSREVTPIGEVPQASAPRPTEPSSRVDAATSSGAVSSGSSAKRSEVSSRTIQEDVESLRALAKGDLAEAAPKLLRVLRSADSRVMRAEAASLLAVLRWQDAAEDTYHEFVRVVDDRGPELIPLLLALRRFIEAYAELPAWTTSLGMEVSRIVVDGGPARPAGLRVLLAIQDKTDISYSDVAITILRNEPEPESLRSLFFLISPEDKAIRSHELIAICQTLLRDPPSRVAAARFVELAADHRDYSALSDDLDTIAASASLATPIRKAAAAALAKLRGSHPQDVYLEYGLQERD